MALYGFTNEICKKKRMMIYNNVTGRNTRIHFVVPGSLGLDEENRCKSNLLFFIKFLRLNGISSNLKKNCEEINLKKLKKKNKSTSTLRMLLRITFALT